MFNFLKSLVSKEKVYNEKSLALNKVLHLVISIYAKEHIPDCFPQAERKVLKSQYDDGMKSLKTFGSKFKVTNQQVELLKINNMFKIVIKYMPTKKTNKLFLEKI
jgi:hypothetical protein